MVLSKEKRQAIIAMHQSGMKCKDIVANGIATRSTIFRIIKQFKETGDTRAKKSSGRPRLSNTRQDRLLIRSQLKDRTSSSATLAETWNEAGVSASTRTVRRRLFDSGLKSRRAAKKPFLSRKNISDRLKFCRKYKDWTVEDWGKVIFSDEAPFRLFGASGKSLVRRRKGERFHQSCVIPTVKHPDTVHVWGCFSSRGIGTLTILPKNTAMNAKWYLNVLKDHLLPTIQEQSLGTNCFFQHDGAPCHTARMITKFLNDKNIEILKPWPGNSPDLNPIENLWAIIKRAVDKQKPSNCEQLKELITQEWNNISAETIENLLKSMPKRIETVLKKKGCHSKY